MATDSHVKSVTNTLTSTTADEITLTQLWPVVRITNHDASNWLYARQDGVAVAEANGTTAIAPGTTRAVKGERAEGTNTIVVSVVGDGNIYTVEGINGGEINLAELEVDVVVLQNITSATFAWLRPPAVGKYFLAASSTYVDGSVTLSSGVARSLGFVVTEAITVDRIGARVVTAAAGSTVSLLIYEDNGAGEPGALLLNAGTIDSTTTGTKEIIINQAIPAGFYHAAWLPLGGNPVMQGATNGNVGPSHVGGSTLDFIALFGAIGYYRTGLATAPDPFAAADASDNGPLITLRRSA